MKFALDKMVRKNTEYSAVVEDSFGNILSSSSSYVIVFSFFRSLRIPKDARSRYAKYLVNPLGGDNYSAADNTLPRTAGLRKYINGYYESPNESSHI